MSSDEAMDRLVVAANHQPAALLAIAAVHINKNPEDISFVKQILVALLS